jgi:MarR family multiple antibiotic resistance transcriptional regulator
VTPNLEQLFSDLVRVEIRLYNVLGERLRAEHGLMTSQYQILRLVERLDDCRVGDLAQAMSISVGAVSKSVDRIESAGWVQRRPNPRNRRSSLIELTPSGRVLLEAASALVEAELRRWVADALPAPDLAQLAAALETVRAGLEQADVGRPSG